jgi:hypothetical protein
MGAGFVQQSAKSQALFTWVILASLLGNATLFLHFAENPVQVIRFDFHRFGDLRSGDAGVLLDQGNCLVGAGATAASATAFARGSSRACGWRRGSVFARATGAATGAGGATGTASDGATKLGKSTLEALALLVELREPFLDQVKGLVEYVAGAGHFLPFIP